MEPSILVGTSGWNYDHWRGTFYDSLCPKSRWLERYTQTFKTVEVNSTFYRLPLASTFEKWKERTPSGFVWSVKANRYITHIKRLQDPEETLKRFFGAACCLEEKMGPVLFQLPPGLAFEEGLFVNFCKALKPHKRRCTFEVRHASWIDERFFSVLRDFNMSLCISDTAGRYPFHEAVTADFAYVRLHGSKELYRSEYTEDELLSWREKIAAWDRDTYVYFDNDYEGYAPKNAVRLLDMLGPKASA